MTTYSERIRALESEGMTTSDAQSVVDAEIMRLESAIRAQGFDPIDCPFTPINSIWESFPIVKAIRKAEKLTGIEYVCEVQS